MGLGTPCVVKDVKPLKTNPFVIIGFLVSMSGCIETTTPVCSESHRIDVPAFEREFHVALLTDASQNLQESVFKVKRAGLGRYVTEGNESEEFTTCRLGSWTVSEIRTKQGNYRQSIVSIGPDGQITQSQMVVDQRSLTQSGVAFEIVERSDDSRHARESEWPRFLKRAFARGTDFTEKKEPSDANGPDAPGNGETGAKQKVLIIKIDGDESAREALGKVVRPQAMGAVVF